MVFGYVAEITLTEGEGTDTPGQLQIVLRIPWKYGPTSAEREHSWMLVRVVAFVSKSPFPQPAQIVKLGSCVTGYHEPISGASKSCQIAGLDVCTIEQWRAMSPSTVPIQWGFNMDALYCLPQLGGANFSYTRLPRVF